MTKTDWNASHYLRYGDERTQPSIDLVAKIRVESPSTVVDLGCGPGNSTQVLHARWPSADICGIDNSPAMIDAASAAFPDGTWKLADLSRFGDDHSFDVVFSNAAIQWSHDHRRLLPKLFSLVKAEERCPSRFQAVLTQLFALWSMKLQKIRYGVTEWAARLRN